MRDRQALWWVLGSQRVRKHSRREDVEVVRKRVGSPRSSGAFHAWGPQDLSAGDPLPSALGFFGGGDWQRWPRGGAAIEHVVRDPAAPGSGACHSERFAARPPPLAP